MPKVGGKHFSYSKKGKTAAKRYAKKTGKTMTNTRKKRTRYCHLHTLTFGGIGATDLKMLWHDRRNSWKPTTSTVLSSTPVRE